MFRILLLQKIEMTEPNQRVVGQILKEHSQFYQFLFSQNNYEYKILTHYRISYWIV